MTAQSRSTTAPPLRPRRAGRGSANGRHVIDLTALRPPEERMADYEEAFGLPSPLHQHGLPMVVSARGLDRVRALLHLPVRP